MKGRKRTHVYGRLTRSLKAIGMSVGRRNCTAFARHILKDPCSLQRVPGSAGKRSSAWTEFSIHFQVQFSNTCPEALQTSHGSPFCATVKRLPSKSWKKTYWQPLLVCVPPSCYDTEISQWSWCSAWYQSCCIVVFFSLVTSSVSSCVKVCLVFKIFSKRERCGRQHTNAPASSAGMMLAIAPGNNCPTNSRTMGSTQ